MVWRIVGILLGTLQGKRVWKAPCSLPRMSFWRLVRPEQASLLPDELTIPLLQFLVFVNLHFTRIESGNIEVISALLPIWLFWTPWDQLGQQQQMC